MFKGLKKEIQDEHIQTLKHLLSGPLREEIADPSFALTDVAGARGPGGRVVGGDAGVPQVWGCASQLWLVKAQVRAEGQQHSQAPLSHSHPCVGPRCQPSALGSSTLPHPRRR